MAKYQSRPCSEGEDRAPSMMVDVGTPPIAILGPPGQPQRHRLALIDPSSALSLVDRSILDTLGLRSHACEVVPTHQGAVETGVYFVSLTMHFDLPFFIPIVQVYAAHLGDSEHKVVLGRNVLKLGTFTYDGAAGRWEVDFSEAWSSEAAAWT